MESVHREVCRLSRVTRSLFLERHVAVNFFQWVEQHYSIYTLYVNMIYFQCNADENQPYVPLTAAVTLQTASMSLSVGCPTMAVRDYMFETYC